MDKLKNTILKNLGYTKLSYTRINKKLNLNFSDKQIEEFILDVINETPENNFRKKGQKVYVINKKRKIKIIINSSTNRVLTADDFSKNKSEILFMVGVWLLGIIKWVFIAFCINLLGIFLYGGDFYLIGTLEATVIILIISVISLKLLKLDFNDLLSFLYSCFIIAIFILILAIIIVNISFLKIPSIREWLFICVPLMVTLFKKQKRILRYFRKLYKRINKQRKR